MTPREQVEAAFLGRLPEEGPLTAYENKLLTSEAERQPRSDDRCLIDRRKPALKAAPPVVTQEQVHFTGSDGAPHTRTRLCRAAIHRVIRADGRPPLTAEKAV